MVLPFKHNMIGQVIVIGSGNLGKRHVEGVSKSSCIEAIHIVDPSEDNREQAAALIKNNKINVHLHETMENIPEKIDLAIIATNANDRLAVTKEILQNREVTNLILEKIVFNKSDHFHLFDKYVENLNTKIFVNFPRRYVDFYNYIKLALKHEKNIQFKVHGGDWGLASNLLHFLDIFKFITSTPKQAKTVDFDIYPISSKRPGYVEFLGEITFDFESSVFVAKSNFSDNNNHLIEIHSDQVDIFIDEVSQYALITKNGKEKKIRCTIPFQSDLSKVVVEELFNTQKCRLPSYKEASSMHLCYLNGLESFVTNKNWRGACNIT